MVRNWGVAVVVAAAFGLFAPARTDAQVSIPNPTATKPTLPTNLGVLATSSMTQGPPVGVSTYTAIVPFTGGNGGLSMKIYNTPTATTITNNPPGQSPYNFSVTLPNTTSSPPAPGAPVPLGQDVVAPSCSLEQAFDQCGITW